MSFAMQLSRRARVGFGVACLAASAGAQFDARDPKAQTQPEPGHFGGGAGSVTMPTLTSEGLLVGAFLDEQEGKRYMLDAKLSTFVPGLFDPYHRVAFGGIYGRLLEVPGAGVLADAQPEFAGQVEGLWRMEKDLTGEYEALVYRRTTTGALELAGAIRGAFQVAVVDAPVPGPQRPDWVARDPIGVGSKDGLDDARSRKSSKDRGFRDAASGSAHGMTMLGVGDAASAHPFSIQIVSGPDLVDARSSSAGSKAPLLGDARSAHKDVKGTAFDDARSAHPFDTPDRPALSDARSSSVAKKGPSYSDARSASATQKAPAVADARSASKGTKGSSLGDAASGVKGSSASKGAQDAWGDAAAGQYGTPSNPYDTAGRGSVVHVPLMMGEFRARFKVHG